MTFSLEYSFWSSLQAALPSLSLISRMLTYMDMGGASCHASGRGTGGFRKI